jgi:hypothetical protein
MQLFVEKDTDLMRSTFVAVGLARLVYALIRDGRADQIALYDVGSAYGLDIPAEPEELLAQVQRLGWLPPLLPAIQKPLSAGEQKDIESGMPAEQIWRKYVPAEIEARGRQVIDYGYQKQLAAADKPAKKGVREEGDAVPRHPDFPVWAHLCSYFGKGSAMRTVYPSILHTWHAHTQTNATELLKLLLTGYGSFPNDIDLMRQTWTAQILPQLGYIDWEIAPLVTASSLVSPSTVQGAATLSAARNMNNQPLDGFWLEFYLAFAGYMEVGMPFTLGSDVLLYYPLPRRISLRRLIAVLSDYRNDRDARQLYRFSNAMLRAKLDTLAHIVYYKSMVAHYHHNLPEPDAPEYEQIDENSITGFVGYYYKDIGGTQIPFDETLFALPAWLTLAAEAHQLNAAHRLLTIHYQILTSVRGKPPKNALTADELILFNTYRRFITLGEAQAWIEFVIGYTAYRFHNLPDMGWLPDLHVDVFEETLMNMQSDKVDYRPIMASEGFQRIATAIRDCTVKARYFKDVKRDTTYAFKVRHGLGDDLLRHAHNPEKFIGELSSFLHDYARESSNVQVDSGKTRTFVSERDVFEIIALIQQYGSFVVAHLLVATGYSSDYRAKAEDAV